MALSVSTDFLPEIFEAVASIINSPIGVFGMIVFGVVLFIFFLSLVINVPYSVEENGLEHMEYLDDDENDGFSYEYD